MEQKEGEQPGPFARGGLKAFPPRSSSPRLLRKLSQEGTVFFPWCHPGLSFPFFPHPPGSLSWLLRGPPRPSARAPGGLPRLGLGGEDHGRSPQGLPGGFFLQVEHRKERRGEESLGPEDLGPREHRRERAGGLPRRLDPRPGAHVHGVHPCAHVLARRELREGSCRHLPGERRRLRFVGLLVPRAESPPSGVNAQGRRKGSSTGPAGAGSSPWPM